MDLTLREVENNIGEIELGDVFYCEKFNGYYIVVRDWTRESYYLQKFNGENYIFYNGEYGEYGSLESLRQGIVVNDSFKFIHYPAKEYRLELVKKPTIGGEN